MSFQLPPKRQTLRCLIGGTGTARGFTLVELLAVVAMVGILAVLAIVGYRQYVNASHSGDAKAIIGAIRVAEENHRGEALRYLGCSATLNSWYPMLNEPTGKDWHWVNPIHPDAACWRILNVVTDSPTRYGFAVVAGAPGETPPLPDTKSKPQWPTPTEPWYVIQAAGDNDEDKEYGYFVASSFTGEIYVQGEGE